VTSIVNGTLAASFGSAGTPTQPPAPNDALVAQYAEVLSPTGQDRERLARALAARMAHWDATIGRTVTDWEVQRLANEISTTARTMLRKLERVNPDEHVLRVLLLYATSPDSFRATLKRLADWADYQDELKTAKPDEKPEPPQHFRDMGLARERPPKGLDGSRAGSILSALMHAWSEVFGETPKCATAFVGIVRATLQHHGETVPAELEKWITSQRDKRDFSALG
jgi:hypothetical protein